MRTKVLLALSITVLATGLVLPTVAPAQSFPDSVRQMVAKAKSEVRMIKMEEFKAAFDKKQTGLIIDVRDPDEFAEGHIPGAINLSRGLIEFRIWPHVGFPAKTDLGTQMTLYCLRGSRCALAARSLRDLGFTNVTAVDMHFDAWVKAGHPVTKPAK